MTSDISSRFRTPLVDALSKLVELGGSSPTKTLVEAASFNDVTLDAMEFEIQMLNAFLKLGLAKTTKNGHWSITPAGRLFLSDALQEQGVDAEIAENGATNDLSNFPSHPYDSTLVKVDFAAFSAFQILRKIEKGEIALQPDFQRLLVWDDVRQSRLIESMLIRIPLPAFYLDAQQDDRWLVVDGLQRLSTLDRFCNKNVLRLKGLEFLPELNGLTFSELPRKYQIQIEDNTRLTFYILQPGTPPNVKFTVFYRINTGGVVLSAQEIRHALFQGQSTDMLRRLASSEAFLEATTGSINPKRMDDRECVLRFLAFYHRDYTQYSSSDLDGFLSDMMHLLNVMPPPQLAALEAAFYDSMNSAYEIFGRYAFRKIYSASGRRLAISKSLFEVWSVELAKRPQQELLAHRQEIVDGYIELMNTSEEFNQAISYGTGNVASVRARFLAIQNLLDTVLQ